MKTILKLTLAAVALLLVSGTNAASAQKFGHVDVQTLVFSMPEMEDVRTNLAALQTELESQLRVMEEEFNKKREDYEAGSEKMTPGVRKVKEDELNSIVQRITNFQQNAESDMQKKQQELIEPLVEKVQVAINNIASEQGLTAVFASAALVYTDKATMVDLMPLAKKRLGIE